MLDFSNLSPVEPDHTEELAEHRWQTLLALDSRPEVRELRESKVPEHTVFALYGYSFESLLPGIMSLIDDDAYRHFRGLEPYEENELKVDRTIRDLSEDVQRCIADDWYAFKRTQMWADFCHHIGDRLPGPNLVQRYNAMVRSLWNACWLMAHRSELDAAWRIAWGFQSVTDWVLPMLDPIEA